MAFKTELHTHTSEVSRCSHIEAAKLVEVYKQNGYRTLVTTDHFSSDTFPNWETDDWTSMVEHYVRGYEAAKAAAGEDFSVLFGMEVRFKQNGNDYLVFGIDRDFLLRYPRFIGFGIEKFIELSRAHGLLTVQAHPFRTGITITDPRFLDGIEVRNMHPIHDGRNDVSAFWAEKYPHLIRTSGSDYHDAGAPTRGGIVTDLPITTNAQLIEVLKSGAYTML